MAFTKNLIDVTINVLLYHISIVNGGHMIYIKEGKGRAPLEDENLKNTVGSIISQVRKGGDEALKELVSKFDNSDRASYFLSRGEIDRAYEQVDKKSIEAIRLAIHNIHEFARLQKESLGYLKDVEIAPGVVLGHDIVPVDSCLCYVPGGNYPLFSTALMLIVPAVVAGVKRIAACSPAVDRKTGINPLTVVAMDMAGATEIAVMGGAQAVAAYSYGTETIDPVAMVVGPGNDYVTEAKRQCYGQIGIDFIAGPSEILIIADGHQDPEILAADLLGQAEHDLNAKSILISTSRELLEETKVEVERQLTELTTADVARKSWEDNGELILASSFREMAEISNEIAPEHLEVMVEGEFDKSLFRNYGSLFIGKFSAEVFGDYTSGTNHTLPTSGAARYTGGLYVGTYLKHLSYQRITKEGFINIKDATMEIAGQEGLAAHYNAVAIREKLL